MVPRLKRIAVFLVIAFLLSTLPMSARVAAQGVPGTTGLYLRKSLQFFDVGSTEIPIVAVAAGFGGSRSTIKKVRVSVGSSSAEQSGSWRAVDAGPAFPDRQSFDRAWAAYQSPGTKKGTALGLSKSVDNFLASAASAFDTIHVDVPKPAGARPGDRYDVTVQGVLDSGQTVTSTATAVAQSLSAPTDWVLGDIHIHSTYSDGIQLSDIRSRAQSLGHSFTYVTDHIDLIRAGVGWNTYYNDVSNASVLPYVMVPGLEVTCSDDNLDGRYDGDALGYGLPSDTDPTLIQNKSQNCYWTVQDIQVYGGYASAGVAHPNGDPAWAVQGTGYKSVQTLGNLTNGDSEPFWTSSMINYSSTCRPSATAGSDLHSVFDSMGPATWLYASGWGNASTVTDKQNTISRALYEGKTAATEQSDLAFFKMQGLYPGSDVVSSTGATVYYDVNLYAPNNGYEVQMTWDFYRGSTRINGGTTAVLPSGSFYSWPSLPTTVQSGRNGYYLIVRFDYVYQGMVAFSNTAYCGPTYTQTP